MPNSTQVENPDAVTLVTTLRAQNLTLATAESCTGGLIAKLITDVPGASMIFKGGMIVYANAMKIQWLKVNPATLDLNGAVSEATILEMLPGIRDVAQADVAIAVSGIAGPEGGTVEKPVGTVFIGWSLLEQISVKRFRFTGDRSSIRTQAAAWAIRELLHLLQASK